MSWNPVRLAWSLACISLGLGVVLPGAHAGDDVCLYIPDPIVTRGWAVSCKTCEIRTSEDIDRAYRKLWQDSWDAANRAVSEKGALLTARCQQVCGKPLKVVVPGPVCVTHATSTALELECTVTVRPECADSN